MKKRLLALLLALALVFSVAPSVYAEEIGDAVASQKGESEDLEAVDAIPVYGASNVVTGTKRYDYSFAVLGLVNAERAKVGKPALTMDVNLMNAAYQRAAEIVYVFDHIRPDGSSCFSAFPPGPGDWAKAENIASGYGNPERVMSGWMNSTGHRRNILDEMNYGFTHIGISCLNVNGTLKWVQLFGKGSGQVPIYNPPANGTATYYVNMGGAQSSPTVYNGVDYSAVYDLDYYINRNSDVKAAFGGNPASTIAHFVNYGMAEGRVAKSSFDVNAYRNNYPDLRAAFGNNLKQYYMHYINYGQREGRKATGSAPAPTPNTNSLVVNGMDYSIVYDFNTYQSKNPDVKAAFGSNSQATFNHFLTYGMREGRVANNSFNVNKYRNNYSDLRNAFGNNLQKYYEHYIAFGKREGRKAS